MNSSPARSTRTRLATSAAACGVCLALAAPMAMAGTLPASVADLATPVPAGDYEANEFQDALKTILGEDGANAVQQIVLTPGTDDTGFYKRNASLVKGKDTTRVVYPESLGPIVAGPGEGVFLSPLPVFAPSYDKSRNVAVDANVKIMKEMKGRGPTVYTGYSQGAEALGNAAETDDAEAALNQGDVILLISDPRSPWGLKSFLSKIPGATPVMWAVGAQNNGARNPADMPDQVKDVSVIVVGDPVGNFQWVWYRPVSSLLVDGAGFLAIHSGTGEYTYANLAGLGDPEILVAKNGDTEYRIYDTYHPLALLNAQIYDALGIEYDETDLKKWDKEAETFYPIQKPTVETADKKAPVKDPNATSTTLQLASAQDSVDDETTTDPALIGDHTRTVGGEPVINAGSGKGKHWKTGPRHAAPETPAEPAPAVEQPVVDQPDAGKTKPDTGQIEQDGTAEDSTPDAGSVLTPAAE
ncbi:MAG: PE-PPE domain-containing protein [Gordonia sp. (in: high G+C Gram-positive bacteria)]